MILQHHGNPAMVKDQLEARLKGGSNKDTFLIMSLPFLGHDQTPLALSQPWTPSTPLPWQILKVFGHLCRRETVYHRLGGDATLEARDASLGPTASGLGTQGIPTLITRTGTVIGWDFSA